MHYKILLHVLTIVSFSICMMSAMADTIKLSTSEITLTVNDKGIITSLKNKQGNEQILASQTSPLLRLKMFNQDDSESPLSASLTTKKEGKEIKLTFTKASVIIQVKEKADYLTMEVTSVSNNDIELLSWGPIFIVKKEHVASSLGVTYDNDYAVGILSLNLKTGGGVEIKRRERFGNAATRSKGGTQLQAYTRDRTRSRTVDTLFSPSVSAATIPGETVTGSKIALYGVPANSLVDLIGKIEIAEGLPHPTHDNKWLKQSPYATSSKLIFNFSEKNIDNCLDIAEASGISCVYHDGIFQSWGTFKPKKHLFPNGMKGVKQCVEKAKARGLSLGTHSLTNFIHPFDPLVTPIPHKDLHLAGMTQLKVGISDDDTTIVLADDTDIEVYNRGKDHTWSPLYAIRIGDEIIEYSSRTTSKPWKLEGCKRGAFGTHKSAHKAGVPVGKFVAHAYKVFFPNIKLQDKVAENLADFFNESGFERIGFDGIEGCMGSGHGRYACERFVDKVFTRLKNKNIFSSSSDLLHRYWHYVTTESWGEPWVGNFRESQLDHRLNSQRRLRIEKLPTKLGQFRITNKTTIEDVNWVMSLCAGLDSGIDFYISSSIMKDHPNATKLLATLKAWETMRMSGQFTQAEKVELAKANTVYELVPHGNSFKLKFVTSWERSDQKKTKTVQVKSLASNILESGKQLSMYTYDYIHINKPREPGQPSAAHWNVKNSDKKQNLQFILRSPSKNQQTVTKGYFKIGALTMKLPFEIKPGEYLICNGDGKLKHFSANKKLLQTSPIKDITLAPGKNVIQFNYNRSTEKPGPKVIVNFKVKK